MKSRQPILSTSDSILKGDNFAKYNWKSINSVNETHCAYLGLQWGTGGLKESNNNGLEFI